MRKRISRRDLIKTTALTAAGVALAACQPQATSTPTPAPTAIKVEPTATAAPQANACQPDWTVNLPPVPKKYSPNVQIESPFTTDVKWLPGDSVTNNPRYNQLKEMMGIEYIPTWEASGDTANQKLQTDIAAGTLPDMFRTSGTQLLSLIQNDALADIKDIWEKTATTLTKEKKQYPDGKGWTLLKSGNKLYGVFYTNGPAYNVDNVGHIRQDWLDKLGLKVPQTIDDLDEVIRTFVSEKLAQIGVLACKNLVTWFMSLDPVFGAYGVMPTCWRKATDGTLQYDSINPAVKDALAMINKWYADGLMDPDFYTKGEGDVNPDFVAGKAGLFFGPWWSYGTTLLTCQQQNPDATFSILSAPMGPHGKRGRKGSGLGNAAVVFRKGLDPTKIEAAINHLNWQVDRHANYGEYNDYSEATNNVYCFTIGHDIDWDDKCELKPGPDDRPYLYTEGWGFWFPADCYPDYQFDTINVFKEWLAADPATLNKAERFIAQNINTRYWLNYYGAVYDSRSDCIDDEFLGVPTENMVEVLPTLQQLESQYYINIVIGKQPVSDFDQFVKEWKQSGGDAVTRDVNDWFAMQK